MAVCVGCGLEVNNGILEVNVCGTPITPNTTTGGLQCDTGTEGGCLKVVLNDSHAGCGLNAVGGALVVDPCDKGGIKCGDTADDAEDMCIYVDVQGQGNGACVVYSTASKSPGTCTVTETLPDGSSPVFLPNTGGGADFTPVCSSPNCNGLVRTCDGLWAPPSIPSINFPCGQIFNFARTPMSNFVQSLGNQGPLLAGSSDGFPGYANDVAFGTAGSEIIIVNAFKLDPCLPIDAMSWTAFTMNFEVKPGELWRFGLHERICSDPANPNPMTTNCNNAWALQSVQYVDARGNTATNIGSVQINDNSTWRFGRATATATAARMEAMITFNRLIGNGALNNAVVAADFQYRNMGHGFHHRLDQSCGTTDATTP